MMVFLQADPVSLCDSLLEGRIDVARSVQSEFVHVIAGRVRGNLSEPRILGHSRQNEMSGQPLTTRDQHGERHPCMERDPGLLSKDLDRSERLDDGHEPIERLPDFVVETHEVGVERAKPSTGVGLPSAGEPSSAARAPPHRMLLSSDGTKFYLLHLL